MSDQSISPTKVEFNGSVLKDVDTVMGYGHICKLNVPNNNQSQGIGKTTDHKCKLLTVDLTYQNTYLKCYVIRTTERSILQ